MAIIALFNGSYCNQGPIVRVLLEQTGFELFDEESLTKIASDRSAIQLQKIADSLTGRTSVFNKFTHEKERSLAFVKLALAETVSRDKLVVTGLPSLLIPQAINHVLRVLLIADRKTRIRNAVSELSISEKEAAKKITGEDAELRSWCESMLNRHDPWDASLYDIVIPTDKSAVEDAVQLVRDSLSRDALRIGRQTEEARNDFLLTARVEVSLAREGHHVGVSVHDGNVTLTINKRVLMLNRLKEELTSIVQEVDGVQGVEVTVGQDFYQPDIYRKYDFQIPSKVLLVDDEREFAQTLSERLLMRDMGSAIAYDGESALDMVSRDEPEVMILDLKMPGIDGIEVLKRVKKSHPNIEVIILTGHGTDKDRKTCMSLGAFAYLEKPVDIDVLAETLKKANDKINREMKKKKPPQK